MYAIRSYYEAQVKTSELPECATWRGKDTKDMLSKSLFIGIKSIENEDIRSLKELLTYGLKGMAAYGEHAWNLNHEQESIYVFIKKALVATLSTTIGADELVGLVLECGKNGVDVMALLDKANTTAFGNPEVTKVNIGVRNNPAILVSGHDLRDLEELLIQTQGTGVDVYTHSEMLPRITSYNVCYTKLLRL